MRSEPGAVQDYIITYSRFTKQQQDDLNEAMKAEEKFQRFKDNNVSEGRIYSLKTYAELQQAAP